MTTHETSYERIGTKLFPSRQITSDSTTAPTSPTLSQASCPVTVPVVQHQRPIYEQPNLSRVGIGLYLDFNELSQSSNQLSSHCHCNDHTHAPYHSYDQPHRPLYQPNPYEVPTSYDNTRCLESAPAYQNFHHHGHQASDMTDSSSFVHSHPIPAQQKDIADLLLATRHDYSTIQALLELAKNASVHPKRNSVHLPAAQPDHGTTCITDAQDPTISTQIVVKKKASKLDHDDTLFYETTYSEGEEEDDIPIRRRRVVSQSSSENEERQNTSPKNNRRRKEKSKHQNKKTQDQHHTTKKSTSSISKLPNFKKAPKNILPTPPPDTTSPPLKTPRTLSYSSPSSPDDHKPLQKPRKGTKTSPIWEIHSNLPTLDLPNIPKLPTYFSRPQISHYIGGSSRPICCTIAPKTQQSSIYKIPFLVNLPLDYPSIPPTKPGDPFIVSTIFNWDKQLPLPYSQGKPFNTFVQRYSGGWEYLGQYIFSTKLIQFSESELNLYQTEKIAEQWSQYLIPKKRKGMDVGEISEQAFDTLYKIPGLFKNKREVRRLTREDVKRLFMERKICLSWRCLVCKGYDRELYDRLKSKKWPLDLKEGTNGVKNDKRGLDEEDGMGGMRSRREGERNYKKRRISEEGPRKDNNRTEKKNEDGRAKSAEAMFWRR